MDIEELLRQEQQQRAEARALKEAALRAELENMSPLENVQLAPLAGAVDSAFGTRVAPGIQAAEAQRAPMRKRADDILDSLMEVDKSGGTGALARQAQDRSKQDAIGERADDSKVNTWFDKIGQNFDKERKALDEIDQQFAGIEDAIISGKYERIKGQLSNYARAVNKEKGVLTDSDLGRTYVDTLDTIYNKFIAKFDKDGKLNPADLTNLADAIADARSALRRTSSERLEQKRNSFKGNPWSAQALKQHESVGDEGYVSGTISRAKGIGNSPLSEWRKQFAKPPAGPPKKQLTDDEIVNMIEGK